MRPSRAADTRARRFRQENANFEELRIRQPRSVGGNRDGGDGRRIARWHGNKQSRRIRDPLINEMTG